MIFVSIYIFMMVLLLSLLSLFYILIAIKLKSDREKYSVFECGFDLLSSLRLPFSLNFYFVTIIFLIFDVELVLILPFVFTTSLVPAAAATVALVVFFLVLVMGFIYEWAGGLLNWLV